MNPGRFALAVSGLALTLLACTGRGLTPEPLEPGPVAGVYRGRVVPADSRPRKFRLWLWAALPDRVHGEVLSPLGRPVLIVDGGAGRLSVAVPGDRVAYVGPASPEAVRAVLGVRLDLDQLVRGLLTGEAGGADLAVAREATGPVGLPERLDLSTSEGRVELSLKRWQALGAAPERLGLGEPPAGLERRPLAELAPEAARRGFEEEASP